jgi:PhzF family phenazine biosynthesis protein
MKIVFVDVFTSEKFRGNNAAVCFVDGAQDAAWMQGLATELAQPVTAYVDPKTMKMRWFAPKAELPLCGHGTLAAAHALWDSRLAKGPLRFDTPAGALAARQAGKRIEIELPSSPLKPSSTSLEEILHLKPQGTFEGGGKLVALLDSEEQVRAVAPDLAAIQKLPVAGVVVTARGSGQFDFISRYFCPAHGVAEDPVTGSAHAVLTPFWAGRLNKTSFTAWQASARGGVVHARLEGDKVVLGGAAVTVLRGELA